MIHRVALIIVTPIQEFRCFSNLRNFERRILIGRKFQWRKLPLVSLKHFLVASLYMFCLAAHADLDDCAKQLIETPGSMNARVCFVQELELRQQQLTSIEKELETELTKSDDPRLTPQAFIEATRDWYRFRESNCWLDAADAVNAEAVLNFCKARLSIYRLAQLRNLLTCLRGDECNLWTMADLCSSGQERPAPKQISENGTSHASTLRLTQENP